MNPSSLTPADAPRAHVPANSSVPGPATDHPVFDAAVLGEMFGNEPALIASVLRTFVSGTAATLSDLRLAAAGQDLAETASLAHKIAGASRLSGASALGDQAHRLEMAAKAGDYGAVTEALQALDAQWPMAQAAIAKTHQG